jgi:predicted DNA-binding protein
MSTISLRLPDSLHQRVRSLSRKDHVSINQFVSTAVAEKLSALETEDYLNERAKRGSKTKFYTALSMIPDREPLEFDRLK